MPCCQCQNRNNNSKNQNKNTITKMQRWNNTNDLIDSAANHYSHATADPKDHQQYPHQLRQNKTASENVFTGKVAINNSKQQWQQSFINNCNHFSNSRWRLQQHHQPFTATATATTATTATTTTTNHNQPQPTTTNHKQSFFYEQQSSNLPPRAQVAPSNQKP